jgi:hypothetical protein
MKRPFRNPGQSLLALTCACSLIFPIVPAFGWGAKGHMMAGRVAVRNLPKTVPLFFRGAVERLAYQIPEPDRWRGEAWGGLSGPRVELTNLTAANHNIRMELLEGIRFPTTRNEYIVLMVERGIVPRDGVNMHKVGMVFYAIMEEMQRLTVEFRLWREAQEAAVLDPAALQQIQENAIFSAGVLGHWITDAAQPLHTTVHSDDWDTRFPNPRNYVTQQIHGRFETVYVDRAISEADIQARMTPARVLGDWREETEAHIRRSFSHVEEVYALDRRGAFGSGKEPEEAHGATAARLAEGAAMLRDAWYSAWEASAKELWDMPVRITGRSGHSALDLLLEVKAAELRGTGADRRVWAIGERAEGIEGRQWKVYSGGKPVTEPPARYIPPDGERLEWRYTH